LIKQRLSYTCSFLFLLLTDTCSLLINSWLFFLLKNTFQKYYSFYRQSSLALKLIRNLDNLTLCWPSFFLLNNWLQLFSILLWFITSKFALDSCRRWESWCCWKWFLGSGVQFLGSGVQFLGSGVQFLGGGMEFPSRSIVVSRSCWISTWGGRTDRIWNLVYRTI